METTIFVLLIYAAVLWVYDNEVAPELRFHLTMRLTTLLARVVRLGVKYRDLNAKRDLQLLYESIKSMDSDLHLITPGALLAVDFESRKDPALLENARERARILDDSIVPGVREIYEEIVEIATKAVVINGVSRMALFAAPWILASVGLDAVKERIRLLTAMSVDDFQRVTQRPQVSKSLWRLLRR
jgi:hypothetical protein